MFKRTIESNLLLWKNNPSRKPLILRGARQVGKTSVVRKFAKEHFENLVEINMEKADQNEYFKVAHNVDEFITKAELLSKHAIIEGKTLLFIDEIQESPETLSLLRFFAEEKPRLHLIVAGSLLEAKMAGSWSVPVGRIEYMHMYPLTFSEYLNALGENQLLNEPAISSQILGKHLDDFLLVGGLPEAVSEYSQSHSLLRVRAIHERIVTAYEDDIDKYATTAERKYLQLIMRFGPKIAGGLYKYENFGESSYRGREISEAIQLLQKVLLLREVPSINSVNLPFVYKYRRAKKLIWLDIGLINYVNHVDANLIKNEYMGRLMEQFVGQEIIAQGLRRSQDLVYWSRNKDEGSAEVDFCIQHNDKVVALEVKSGTTRSMKSLFSMIDTYGDKVLPVRISRDELKVENYLYNQKKYHILSIPFYLLGNLGSLISTF